MNFQNISQKGSDESSNLRNKIISFLKMKGPSLPYEIATLIKRDTIIASAFLSELISAKIVKMSNLRIGSSPLYFLPGQEAMLEKFTEHLQGNELEAYNIIKEKKLVKDSDLSPKDRVSMGFIKDFAIPIKVITPEGEALNYWKFYSLGNDEVSRMLSDERKNKNKVKIEKEKIKLVTVNREIKITKKQKDNEKIESKNTGFIEMSEPDNEKIEQKQISEDYIKNISDNEIKSYSLNHLNYFEQSLFFREIIKFIMTKNLKIKNFTIVKKSRHFEFDASVKNDVLDFKVHCVAKSKKIISDKDVKSMANDVFDKRMISLLITNGKISKKAQEIFNSNHLLIYVTI